MTRDEIAWVMFACAHIEQGGNNDAACDAADVMLGRFKGRFPPIQLGAAKADKVRRGVRK